ncbi:hypothetical protein BU16DRAFT_247176 [Lophium mytilinum]|uniref:RING-type domain-containing protein n=1 Tax=Lophium mytilinum TaxID=390894 RepID=A0A6A6R7J8_9PEZI|nr:hypothetical protein BU16DRAFT_247176 [Lophium mytilinum]
MFRSCFYGVLRHSFASQVLNVLSRRGYTFTFTKRTFAAFSSSRKKLNTSSSFSIPIYTTTTVCADTASFETHNQTNPARMTSQDEVVHKERVDAWEMFVLGLEDVDGVSEEPADQFEVVNSTSLVVPFRELINLRGPTKFFWRGFQRFQEAMRYDHAGTVDMLASHINNRMAFCDESDLDTYRKICDLEELMEQLCAALDDKEDVSEAIKSSNILSSMYEAGQNVRKQLDEGVRMLAGCNEVSRTYVPAGYPIPVSSVSTRYEGPPENCSICFDMVGPRNGRAIACHHAFHWDCLEDLINSANDGSNKCPLCRDIICDRRARTPGPDEHHFNQRLALEAIHSVYYARLNLATLRSLYNCIFAEEPPWDWLNPDHSWEDWPRDELDYDDEDDDDEESDEDDQHDDEGNEDDDESSSTGSGAAFNDFDVEMKDVDEEL